ncbi:Anthranilate phosphoribosyltransferase [Wickerhamomyces ciferrii]|uniref:Anthranilate phosphoribosyltransferase n=1 Tax=Wickerhamomyces ciferrii (strain ATCC 14091 / BCRC 22168 / CBS 111 / JCM 3599 / NBRC 0793 / NRRL Y-1031 F-60-10) TaxID=1206466 RepID=K0KWG2_WICCF|nr:Anthranilate phosphoribosyltransferase [Wickerhamomyces ciferrii]CCH45488.1 Anthranilate phosphoribosyltransferase [Wickerhamomyces ciferrii]
MSLNPDSVLTPFIKSLLLDPPNLKPDDLSLVIKLIVQGIPSDVQIASFLTALRIKGLDHKPEFIAAAASRVLEYSDIINPLDVDPQGYVDIVGTGGDGQNTFNVSTSSAIVAAGIGIDVCKHGGKASTSTSGSGDLLGSLGVDLSKVTNKTASSILKKSKFVFLFAPNFHSAMKKVAKIRTAIGIPTIFNILGPLLNPAPLKARIIGVYSESLGQVFAEAVLKLDKLNCRKAKSMIVWGCIGLDEISPIGQTKVWIVDPDLEKISIEFLQPSDFNIHEHSIESVKSGTPKENADLLIEILNNKFDEGHPVFDYITLNTAALAVISGEAKDWKHGKELAIKSIKSGAALKALDKFKQNIEEYDFLNE